MTFIVLKLKKKKSLNQKELFWLFDIVLDYVCLDRHFVALSNESLVQLRSLWNMWDVSFNSVSRKVSLKTDFFFFK